MADIKTPTTLVALKVARAKSAKQQGLAAIRGVNAEGKVNPKTDAEKLAEAKKYGGQKVKDLKARVSEINKAVSRLFALEAALSREEVKSGKARAFQITFPDPEAGNRPATVTVGREQLKQMQAKVLASIQELSFYFSYAKKRAPKLDAAGRPVKSKSFGLIYLGQPSQAAQELKAVNPSAASNPLIDYLTAGQDFAQVRQLLAAAAAKRGGPDAITLLQQRGISRRGTLTSLLRLVATMSQIQALNAGQSIGDDGSVVAPTTEMATYFGARPSIYHYDGKTNERVIKDGKAKDKAVKVGGASTASAFASLAAAPVKLVPKGRVNEGQPQPFNPNAIHLYDIGSIVSLNAFEADAKKAGSAPNLAAAIQGIANASAGGDVKATRDQLEAVTLAADADVSALTETIEAQRDSLPQYKQIKAVKAARTKEKAKVKAAQKKAAGGVASPKQ